MIGKLNPEQLSDNVLSLLSKKRDEVVLNAAQGEDCAAIRSNKLILLTTDPVTACDFNCAKSAINVCCNDLAACGAEPIAVLLTLLLPKHCTEKDVKKLMLEAEKTAAKLNVDIIGGHTEFTDAVNRTIVCATAVGTAEKIITSSGANVGDYILVTGNLALEGTAILAEALKKHLNLPPESLDEAKNLVEEISVVKEGLAARFLPVSAMHDITEGGVFGAVCEIAAASNLGAKLDCDKMPFLQITDEICKQANVDKFKLISSGSMLITTVSPQIVIDGLKQKGIKATIIGKMTETGTTAVINGKETGISVQPDEIGRLSKIEGELNAKHDRIR